MLTGVGFAFAIAGLMKTPEGANQLNIGIFTPVLLLGGAQSPLDGLLGGFADLAAYVVPFAAVIATFRGVVAGARSSTTAPSSSQPSDGSRPPSSWPSASTGRAAPRRTAPRS